ncbi:di-cis-decaprenylcistransferase [Grosmannia clavigera kw1407]|uniref:ditrans,polycis-polyprenyl diphosphate synthase [(2E,6E)-farnesyldiphosphate specific] n=1 Tax=Grosmannia clavigera (strain kw1407 / UAMH 11150) TaxID=655863 RepID=F0XHC4_GROCL|nr:di-cis-decaprenylcistransferase [Grosmannia clavigera kw1407]EFX02747.1 di-cis-decaprenylcistransferase [Grosmannia clavigera kw1407]
MPYPRRRTDFIRDVAADRQLTPEESYQMLQKFLPAPPPRSATRAPAAKSGANKTSKSDETASDIDNLFIGRRRSRTGARRFVLGQIHILLYTIIHTVFSLYMRIRQAYHEVRNQIYSVLKYHHRTPEIIARDVRDLSRIPKHLSVILRLEEHGREGAELERLVNEISDIAAWCASAGIPTLSVYEKRGVLKSYLPETHRAVSTRLASYFGRAHPAVTLQAPHVPAIHSAAFPRAREYGDISEGHIKILLLSEEDGRDSLVDLTKTLADMAQRTKISASDVSIDLIDAELTESIMTDPDLLILFGPYVELFGYPPWQIRLTEIFHVPDNHSVGYQVFLWGLQNYAKAEMRVGR